MFDGKAMADEVVKTVRDFVARSVEPIKHSLADLDQRIKEMPVPKDGKDADPEQIRETVSAEVNRAVSELAEALVAKFTTHA